MYTIIHGQTVARGVFVPSYMDSLRKSVMEFHELGILKPSIKVIELEIKDGLDGAGNQIAIKEKWTKMVTMGFVVVKVTDQTSGNDVTIYDNPVCNSNFSLKPLCMVLQDENYELCKSLFARYPSEQPNTVVDITSDYQVNVIFKIKRCMIDGKLRGIMSGRSAAHCFGCDWTLDDYYVGKRKGEAIHLHYLMYDVSERSAKSENVYFRLLREGLIGCRDAKKRMNYTEQPIAPLESMTILHSVINCCKLMFNTLVIAECCDLSSVKPNKNMSSKNVKLRDAGIKKYSKRLLRKTGICVRDIGHNNTGGGLVGNHAKAFFEHGDQICDTIFKNSYREQIKKVIQNLYVILAILNSNLPVIVERFSELCRTTTSLLLRVPYFRFNITIHTLLFHSWEHIQNNGCKGLGKYGEDAIEMAMGRGRNARKFQAFRGSLTRNMTDAHYTLQLESDSYLNRNFIKVKRSQVCNAQFNRSTGAVIFHSPELQFLSVLPY